MPIIDMIEPLIPCLDAHFLESNHGLAETAPEAALAIPTHAALPTLFFHVPLMFMTAEIVCFVQVGHERFAAVAETAALFGDGRLDGLQPFAIDRGGIGAIENLGFGAFPGFDLVVHGIFVTFPVVLAAEAAWAVDKGAAVGTGMAFKMFPTRVSLSHPGLRAERFTKVRLSRT